MAPGEETTDEVTVGGRVVFVRNTGKLCFASLQDGFTETSNGERLQIMLSKAEVGDESLAAWKSDVDLGDHVWVRGRVVVSRRVSYPSWLLSGGWPPRLCVRCRPSIRSSRRRAGASSLRGSRRS